MKGLLPRGSITRVGRPEVAHRFADDLRAASHSDRPETLGRFGGEHSGGIHEELMESAIADLGLTPVGGEQMTDRGLHAFELLEKYVRAVVDADRLPDRLDLGPIPVAGPELDFSALDDFLLL